MSEPSVGFGTNIFTGNCKPILEGCAVKDKWYLKKECDLDKKEKIDLIKNNKEFTEKIRADCDSLCERKDSLDFCKAAIADTSSSKITCADLFDCQNMACI